MFLIFSGLTVKGKMYVLIVTMVACNIAFFTTKAAQLAKDVCENVATNFIGKRKMSQLGVMVKLAKILVLRRVGYYDRITAVTLHSGKQKSDVTKMVKSIDPTIARSSFITSSAFFFHEMGLDKNDVLEITGLDENGSEFSFVIDWDSTIALPLMANMDNPELVKLSICSATAVYTNGKAGVREDITNLVRKWTRCCEIERVLGFIARDHFNASDSLLGAVMSASDEDRFEIHVLFSDLTSKNLVYDHPARLLISL